MATSHVSFSDDGEHLAYSSSDGILRIVESSTGILKQEYSSSSHLSATTSALSWSRQKKQPVSPPKAKKRKQEKTPPDTFQDDLMLIALGTTTGAINLYSFSKGTLHTQLTKGHTSTVNDVCWHLTNAELFSCSEDQHVVHWDLKKGKVKHKWKCDSSSLHSVSHCSQNRLLTAGHLIKLWDLSTREVLQTFTGHSSPIFQLLPVHLDTPNEGGDCDSCYALSAAVDDRHINVWHCSGSKADKSSIASFSVPDEVVSMSLSKPNGATQPFLLAVITRKGTLHVFEHIFNGKKKKPLVCKITIKAVTQSSPEDEATHVPVQACCFQDGRVLMAIGNPMRPQFESLAYDSSKPEWTVTVATPAKSLKKEEYSQVKKPVISEHVTTMTPADSQPKIASKNKGKRRSRKSSVSDLTVEERLNAMSSDAPKDAGKHRKPVATSLSTLLQQGLNSGDGKILREVFQQTNEAIVRDTVKSLPLSCIVPLIEQIERGINGHAQYASFLIRWLAALVAFHTSYILSVPEVINKMSKLYQTVLIRQKFYPKVLQLKGRLDLVRSQKTQSEGGEVNVEALLIHQDESDDSDSMVIDGPAVESDVDEHWEELSDVE